MLVIYVRFYVFLCFWFWYFSLLLILLNWLQMLTLIGFFLILSRIWVFSVFLLRIIILICWRKRIFDLICWFVFLNCVYFSKLFYVIFIYKLRVYVVCGIWLFFRSLFWLVLKRVMESWTFFLFILKILLKI